MRIFRVLRAAFLALTILAAGALPAAAQEAPPEMLRAVDVGGLEARSAALVMSGQQGGHIPLSLLAVPFPAAEKGGSPRLGLVVDIEGTALLGAPEEAGDAAEGGPPAEEGPPEDPIVEVHAYALTEEGGLAAFFTQAFVLERSAAARGGVKFLGGLELPPGGYSLRLLVRERGSGRLALRALPVVVPAFGLAQEIVLPPLVPAPVGSWTLVRQSGEGAAATLFPLRLGGRTLVPSTRPLLMPGGELLFVAVTAGGGVAPGAVSPGKAALSARLVPRDGGEGSLAVLSPRRSLAMPPGSGLAAFEFVFEDPGLPPGEVLLELTGAGGARSSLPLVAVPPELAEAAPQTWPELVAARLPAPAASRQQAPATVSPPAREALEAEELARVQAAYLGALGPLSRGDRRAALAAVADMESAGLDSGTADEALARGQLRAAVDLAGAETEILLPLIHLHEDLYVENRRRERFRLASHSRRVIQALADLYARRRDDPEAAGVAAVALVALAGHLLDGGNSVQAMGLLEEALDYDPRQPAALLALAAGYELLGETRRAVTLLERLLAVRPDDPEGLLRLGVNEARLGSTRRARELLAAAARAERPAWVAVVAGEELAALHAAQGEAEEAVAVLRRALERFPVEQRLHIQLAAVLDQAGRPAEARAALDALDRLVARGTGGDRDSPRLRYSSWPREELEAARRSFVDLAEKRLPKLSAALVRLLEQEAGEREG